MRNREQVVKRQAQGGKRALRPKRPIQIVQSIEEEQNRHQAHAIAFGLVEGAIQNPRRSQAYGGK